MKRLLFLFTLCAIAWQAACAYDFMAGGIAYNFNSDSTAVSVTATTESIPTGVTPSSYAGDISIPSLVEYSGATYPVTSIDDYSFYHCSDLTKVSIPNTVTSVGEWAFYGCISLTEVTLSNSISHLKSSVFSNCSELTHITIPNSVSVIDNFAFYNCSKLSTLEIPRSVTSISKYAFNACSGLGSIIVDEGNHVYDSRDNCNAIIETSTNNLIKGCKATLIPGSVTSIGENAFILCTSLSDITIPGSVISIGENAFSGCSGLSSVVLPNSVTSIGGSSFYGCSNLLSLTIPDSVVSIGEFAFYGIPWYNNLYATLPDGIIYLGKVAYTFKGTMAGNARVEIADGTLGIGDNAFNAENNGGPLSITLPNTVVHIGQRAFLNCSSLASLYIPASVKSIGTSAFGACWGLSSIVVDEENTVYDSRDNCNAIIETCTNTLIAGCRVTNIPRTVTAIGEYAFAAQQGISSLTIPGTINKIDENAFSACFGLKDVYVERKVPVVLSNDIFSSSTYETATLHCPKGSGDKYRETDYWKQFNNILDDHIIKPGDIDGDDIVDIIDLNAVINSLLGKSIVFDTDVNRDGVTDVSDINMLVNIMLGKDKDADTHEYVDLGLPGGVLWATCNIGAETPQDNGLYFAWGDATGYARNEAHTFDWAHYKWMTPGETSPNHVTKYTFADGSTGSCWYQNGYYIGSTIDGVKYKNLTNLLPNDDAATTHWGHGWRMPSEQEFKDLIDSQYTTCEVINTKNVYALKITSKSNGNSILLPLAGYRQDSALNSDCKAGRYWSSTLSRVNSTGGYCLRFSTSSSRLELSPNNRSLGASVRPVRNK